MWLCCLLSLPMPTVAIYISAAGFEQTWHAHWFGRGTQLFAWNQGLVFAWFSATPLQMLAIMLSQIGTKPGGHIWTKLNVLTTGAYLVSCWIAFGVFWAGSGQSWAIFFALWTLSNFFFVIIFASYTTFVHAVKTFQGESYPRYARQQVKLVGGMTLFSGILCFYSLGGMLMIPL